MHGSRSECRKLRGNRQYPYLYPAIGRLDHGKGVVFGTDGIEKFTANLQGEGTLEIRLDDIEADPVASLDFSTPEAAEVSIDCPTSITGSHDVYFLFTETRGEVKFDTWQFDGKGPDAITNTEMEDSTPLRYEYYLPQRYASYRTTCRRHVYP